MRKGKSKKSQSITVGEPAGSDFVPWGQMPTIGQPESHDIVPGGRVFRKTVAQLALDYQKRLDKLGLYASLEDVAQAIREDVKNVVGTLVREWTDEERKQGIEIV